MNALKKSILFKIIVFSTSIETEREFIYQKIIINLFIKEFLRYTHGLLLLISCIKEIMRSCNGSRAEIRENLRT